MPKLGIALPSSAAPKHQAAMARLSQLSGPSFNQVYLNERGINAHLENAATFQREVALGQNPDLIGVANKGLPIINTHFNTASTLTQYRFAQVPQRFNTTSGTPDARVP